MLKREDSKDILNGVSIKIPTLEETSKLMKKLNNIAKTVDGNIDYDNPKAIYLLFKNLVISNIPEIKNIKEKEFMECYYNPTPEMETICFEIGKVVSNSIKSMLRNNIAQLIDTELKLIQAEAVTRLNSMSSKAREISKIEKDNNN